MSTESQNTWYADIILTKPLRQYYTYSIPENLLNQAQIGSRVIVQFGSRKFYTGIIKELHQNKPEFEGIKEIDDVLDDKPFIKELHLKFWEWIANYYMCSIGEVFKAALPAGLKIETETKLIANEDFEDHSLLSEQEKAIFVYLEQLQIATIKDVGNIFNLNNPLRIMNSLLEKNAIVAIELIKHKYKPKFEKYIILNEELEHENKLDEIFDSLIKAPKQFELFTKYIDFCADEDTFLEIKKQDLLASTGSSPASVKALIDKNIFQEISREVNRVQSNDSLVGNIKSLSELQDEKLKEIQLGFKEKTVGLLHGVTSSGKTEIYIHLIKEYIDQGKQVLYLLPEIALTAQIINRLRDAFGDQVGVYHSKFSDAERVETFQEIAKGSDSRFKIILGVRSSVFLPYSDLGLIIVDEEHENTFKQYDPAPRYHARDAAIVLANLTSSKVLLGSATPSVESYYNAKTEKYFLTELFTRHKNIELPKIILADTRTARRKKQMKSMFTPQLIEEISNSLDLNEQVILFQNRRGYSPFIECDNCGWIPKCDHCDVSLTYHKFNNSMVCHYCNHTEYIPPQCPSCGSAALQTQGFGTEKIEDDLAIYFPDASVVRMDFDTTRKKNSYENIITQFEEGEIDILVGTQMISKGLDFENVNLVGILNADNLLNFPNYRSFERAFQLMSQVSGRAGRSTKRGKVIIQTSNPGHPIIKQVLFNEYHALYAQQIEERQLFKYPPFYRHIKVTLKHKKVKVADDAINKLVAQLKHTFGQRVLGPELPMVNKIQDLHIRNLHLKIERDKATKKAKDFIISTCNKMKEQPGYSSLQIFFDVDPF